MDKEEIEREIYTFSCNLPLFLKEILNCFKVEFSKEIKTAAVKLSSKPTLYLNEEFIKTHCRKREHLMMLVLHEAMHICLGHTRLFGKKLSLLDNIVFDAVVNSTLIKLFKGYEYKEFFKSLNPSSSFPGCLLRPMEEDTPMFARKILKLLYESNDVTYQEIYSLILKEGKNISSYGIYVLLGDHENNEDISPFLKQFLQDDKLEENIDQSLANLESSLKEIRVNKEEINHKILFNLEHLLAMAGVKKKERDSSFNKVRSLSNYYSIDDRRAAIKLDLENDFLPSYKKNRLRRNIIDKRESEKALLYLDVSNSLNKYIPSLLPIAYLLEKQGKIDTYQFSEGVSKANLAKLYKGIYESNGGTSIESVLSHYLSLDKRPDKIIIVTDGYFASPKKKTLDRIIKNKVSLYFGIINGGGQLNSLFPGAKVFSYRLD